MPRTALIIGVTGQDGAYLARKLLDSGYVVHGSSRDAELARLTGLQALGIAERVRLHSVSPLDLRSVLQVVNRSEPDEVYNLSGQSSVALSFSQPVETMESIAVATLNILETLRLANPRVRFYNAGSSESFGDTGRIAANEETPFRPRSPYGVAKATAFWQVANYRDAYGLFACSGILFNHESPLRPQRFVTRKVVAAACRIAAGSGERLKLGNIDVERDWGWAPEYVDAMWRILQVDKPDDFVIATGHAHALRDFVAASFAANGLDWRDHVESDPSLMRPSDIAYSVGDPGKAARVLGWHAQVDMTELVRRLVHAENSRRGERVMRALLRQAKPLGQFAAAATWRAADGLGLAPARPPVAMVIERAEWAIRWYGTFIVDEVNRLEPGIAWTTPEPARLTRGVVQFGSQYQWVDWQRHLSPRCRFVVSFMHGKREDGPEAARHIDRFLDTEKHLSRIVCTARLVLERLAGWGVPRAKLVNIPIGCETDVFVPPTAEERRAARQRLGIADEQICVGSFQKDGTGWGEGDEPKHIKGPDLFLAAIDRLRRHVPVFVMLTGPARGYVRRGLERLGVKFAHVYAKDRAELARCYHPLDIYFITSREEGGPMALMESMASGIPVVSTRVGMAPDLITDGVTGALVEGEDMDRLVMRALELLALPDRGAALRDAARQAVKIADWSIVGRRHLEEIYRPLL